MADPEAGEEMCWVEGKGREIVLRLDEVRFTVTAGTAIDIVAPVGKPPSNVRLWLLGTVIAALLHQRGYMPIHANAVALERGRAAAFAGQSGAGKSTLAAWFESRGHEVLADDVCAIAPGEDGRPLLFEGIPRIKLWAETLAAFGRDHEGLERVSSDFDKYHVAMGRAHQEARLQPFDLERLYLLERAAEGEPFRIQPLAGADAARGVIANSFRWELGQRIQPPTAQFEQCLALARHASVFQVRRRWDFGDFTADAKAIERHMQTPLAELAS